MVRRKVKVSCLYCNKEFESTLRWEGIPEKEYCSTECDSADAEFGEFEETNFEKLPKGGRTEWL
jgi:hypothetical protein